MEAPLPNGLGNERRETEGRRTMEAMGTKSDTFEAVAWEACLFRKEDF